MYMRTTIPNASILESSHLRNLIGFRLNVLNLLHETIHSSLKPYPLNYPNIELDQISNYHLMMNI
jgi:hypothetical protein